MLFHRFINIVCRTINISEFIIKQGSSLYVEGGVIVKLLFDGIQDCFSDLNSFNGIACIEIATHDWDNGGIEIKYLVGQEFHTGIQHIDCELIFSLFDQFIGESGEIGTIAYQWSSGSFIIIDIRQ